MKHQRIETGKAPGAIGPYSQAVKAGDWLFVSGQLGLDPKTGDMVSDRFEDQAEQALANMKQILAAAGFDLTWVVAVDVYLMDMAAFSVFNRIYDAFFEGHRPARAVVQVAALPKSGLLEVKCTAKKPSSNLPTA